MASNSVNNKTTLRQLMKQEKQKRIDSPLAKYTNTGQLTCALCNQPITSELYWKAHVNGREHKQKVLELKSNIQKPSDEATFVKPLPPSSSIAGPARGIKRSHDVAASDEPAVINKPPVNASPSSSLPADFFDSAAKPISETSKSMVSSAKETLNSIPEGFFDDPQLDARVRKVEYVDKMEAEWDTFTREMKQETNVSAKLEANDDVERDYERDISETTELITRWQKIEQLHDIKDSRFKVKKQTKTESVRNETISNEIDEVNDEDLEKELESMYNWRQKRS